MLVSPKKKENRDTARQAKAFEGTKGPGFYPWKGGIQVYMCVSLYTDTHTTCVYIYIRACPTRKRETPTEAVIGKRSSWLRSSS